MFCWVPIPEPWRSRMSTMDFGMLLLEKGNVAVSPGSGFGPAGEGYLRMSLVENEARLRQAARQIKACLREAERKYSAAPALPPSVPSPSPAASA
jgi:alanine-synthesizing transaminase